MHSTHFSALTYVIIYVLLLIFTFGTVAASFLPLEGGGHIAVGLSIGLVKAGLVALFFMHLIHSPGLTWCVVGASIFWLSLLMALTISDYASRGLIPGMPGH